MGFYQIDCLGVHLKFLKMLAVWPDDNPSTCYKYYSRIFLILFVYVFLILYTINFYFLPKTLDIFAEEMLFYFTVVAVLSKALAFIFMQDEIKCMLHMLESEIFQSDDPEAIKIIKNTKRDIVRYWNITAVISVVANSTNIIAPLVSHLMLSIELVLPVSRYSFIPEEYKAITMYPTYVYQSLGINAHMLYNVNFDTFLLAVMLLGIAQLDILDSKLRKVTDVCKQTDVIRGSVEKDVDNYNALLEIKKCIKHYDAICRYCKLIEQAFSETLFVQFSLGSCKICVCLFRFTLHMATQYYVFLSLYLVVMILQIMVPCWFGSQIMEKSNKIAFAVYNCDWTPRCRKFKSNLRLLVERANQPLTIKGGKMFLLSLGTFTAIVNSAYSFFNLLRHMQSR